MSIFIKRNDVGDVITYTCEHEDGTIVNLANATVRFIMGKKNKVIATGNAVILDAPNGAVQYTLLNADTLVSGNFPAEFEVTFQNGNVKTFPTIGYLMVNIEQNLDLGKSSQVSDQIALRVSDIETFKTEINVKMAQADADASKVNSFETRINNIVSQAGTDNTEIVDSRYSQLKATTYATLTTRLNQIETDNINTKKDLEILYWMGAI